MRRGDAVGLVHNRPAAAGEANADASQDVMVQVETIEEALRELGRRPVRLPFSANLGDFLRQLEESGAACVFNLCESVDENPRLLSHPAAVLELLDMPYTGSCASALASTTDKQLMKLILRGAGIDTPASLLYTGEKSLDPAQLPFPLILKPQFEDASIGIDQESVLTAPAGMEEALRTLFTRHGPLLIEEYVDGREFNVSLFGSPVPAAMPVAEIDFSSYPDTLHKIVGYQAKWVPDSVEYRESRRIFPHSSGELDTMAEIAARCFRLFGLRDYGRVDFRIDGSGRIRVLEINANPCLSPDAGFCAALHEGGINYQQMVARFLDFLAGRMP